jgi:O-antigen ligase
MSLLPAVAVFLAMLSLGARTRRRLVVAILVIVFLSVGLDLLQMMDDDAGAWRFYAITNPDRAVGFFANANHNAALLYCAVPFILAWAIGLLRDRRQMSGLGLTLLSLLIVVIIIGLTVTRSRAGIALLGFAGLACIVMAWRHDRGHTSGRVLPFVLGANLIAGLIAFQFGFVSIMQRVEQSEVIEDIRWPVAKVTAEAALAHMPLGSGFGTFVPVYDRFAPRTLVMDRYVNHAHDDWLELWLTGGVPAIVLVLCFLGWFAAVSASAWRENPGNGAVLDIALARAASIVIFLLMLHSLVDYPLRTAALDVLFAICCALLIPLRGPTRAEGPPTADRPVGEAETTTNVIRDERYA